MRTYSSCACHLDGEKACSSFVFVFEDARSLRRDVLIELIDVSMADTIRLLFVVEDNSSLGRDIFLELQ
jgi:hypothetical protein